ncbi:MAG: SurA N-terminal domain-containing protein [Planctomycetes bacterium]|nr:SurA N-terminal domain-containing protein [Planctomycetota bacterium]
MQTVPIVAFAVLLVLALSHIEQASGQNTGGDDPRPEAAGRRVAAGIVATVDGTSITSQELEKELLRRPLEIPPTIGPRSLEEERAKHRKRVLEDLIFQKLQLARCDKLEIKVSEAELNAALQDHLAALNEDGANIGSLEEFFRMVEDQTTESEAEARERFRQELRVYRLYRDHVYRLEFIAPRQLRAYYDAHRDEFSEETTYTLRRIYIPNSNPDLGRILEQLKNDMAAGVEFTELVQRYYDGPRRDEGGLIVLTDTQLRDYQEPVPRVVRALEPGSTSEIVADEFGVIVFHLIDRKVGEPQSFEEAQEHINQLILDERREAQRKRFAEELRAKAEIKYYEEEPSAARSD